jgi:hypothetical protein
MLQACAQAVDFKVGHHFGEGQDMLGKRPASKSAVASARGEAKRDCCRLTGHPESAGINRHVVGDARALQERK